MDVTSTPDATCPRCGGRFHCGAHDAAPCPCGSFTLSADTTRTLRETYAGCLCLKCLAHLQSPSTAGREPGTP